MCVVLWWEWVIVITPFAIPILDFITMAVYQIVILKQNPFVTEKGKVGTYFSISQYNTSGKAIGKLDISFDELFGLTTNTGLQFERDSLFNQNKGLAKEKEELKEQLKDLMSATKKGR